MPETKPSNPLQSRLISNHLKLAAGAAFLNLTPQAPFYRSFKFCGARFRPNRVLQNFTT